MGAVTLALRSVADRAEMVGGSCTWQARDVDVRGTALDADHRPLDASRSGFGRAETSKSLQARPGGVWPCDELAAYDATYLAVALSLDDPQRLTGDGGLATRTAAVLGADVTVTR